MSIQTRPRLALALLGTLVLAMALAACGAGAGGVTQEGGSNELRANRIEDNPQNHGVAITVGSKNFTEEYVLAEIYARALRAAGYAVRTKLDLGSEQIALAALRRLRAAS